MPIPVLIYEDYDILRESIASMLAIGEQYKVIGSYSTAEDVINQVNSLKPSCLLMDIDMPGINGIGALKKLRGAGIAIPVIMLTVFDDNENVFNALRAGASGYLLKKHISTKLAVSLDEVLSGGAPMSPAIARMVIRSLQIHKENDYQLTKREKEILSSLSEGNSYKMIAEAHSISIETVRSHIKKIYEKLQVHSQTEAVSKAIHEGLV